MAVSTPTWWRTWATPVSWVVGDSVYGDARRLRLWLEESVALYDGHELLLELSRIDHLRIS